LEIWLINKLDVSKNYMYNYLNVYENKTKIKIFIDAMSIKIN